jgi:hypothetical protein
MILYVNLYNTLEVTSTTEAINTIYEANVEQPETEILELQYKFILKAYNLGKNVWQSADLTQFPMHKKFCKPG